MPKCLMRFFLGLYVFFFIFNPTNFFSFNLLYVLFFVAVLSIPFNLTHYFFLIKKTRLAVYAAFLFYMVNYLLVLGFLGRYDAFYMAYNYLLIFISLFCCFFIVVTYGRLYSISFHGFLSFMINIGVVQLIFVMMTLFSPDLRELVIRTSRLDDLWSISNDYGGLRSYGLANAYTSSFPMLMGVYALLIISVVNRTSLFNLKFYFFSFLLFLFVFSVILNARIGLVPLFAFFIITIFSMFYNLRLFVSGFRFLLLIGFAIFCLMILDLDLDMYLTRLIWGIEEVVILFYGERVGTFQALEKMIHFPKDIMVLFFGSGLTVFGDQVNFPVSSDIGLVRDIYMFGLLNTMLLVLIFFYLTGTLRAFVKFNFGNIAVISLYLALLAYYFKGAILSSSEIYNFIILFSVFSVCLKSKMVWYEKNSYN